MMFRNKKSKNIKLAAVFAAAVLVIIFACAAYLGDYYRADMDAVAAFSASNTVEMRRCEKGDLVWEPEQASSGFIFLSRGKGGAHGLCTSYERTVLPGDPVRFGGDALSPGCVGY